jgi:methionyl-tRNA formyltransferase
MESKNLRIVFMGTPDFAVGVLDKLVTENYNVVGVVTVADKPAGRGKIMTSSAVKKYAEEKKIKVLQPNNLKNEDFLTALTNLEPDLQIVVAFRMLPKAVWSLPKFGTFNLHASLLPAYRGSAPINWAIINGEKETGVTTFFIDEKIDTGEIVLSEKIKISEIDTAGTIHDKLMLIGADLVVKTVDIIANQDIKTKKQPDFPNSLAPKLFNENCQINWNDNIDNIYNFIRGLSPFPTAWTKYINEQEIGEFKIYNATKENEIHEFEIGKIISSKNGIKIAVKSGYIIIDEIQMPSKKRMDTKSLLNGYKFSDLARVL